ncbi:hypothetical protein D3879_23175 [Pseudomonas cavernicola]|uniref:DNA repair protein n=1 Tax=Pseudomonas cavernicola TaxID=2320866 RepID=A0A418X8H7_9PSED|nr:hypothetical protein [Pseudomonas cavernicola]RJG08777.1 hypothetical protein D3879_23175 [Pseudomonas cavernicola]
MSPLVITLLIVTGISILIAIGYITHMVENSKLEKARLRADLNDRLRRCNEISEALPGQLMSPALKLLLCRLLLQFSERMLVLDKNSAALKERIEELRGLIGKGESIPVRNPQQPILTEAKAKDIRFLLENLHGQITRSAQDAFLPTNEAKHWFQEVREMLVQLHIELFNNVGQQALQQNQPGQARLAFERGVQYLRKQPDPTRYQGPLKQLENLLARANSMVLENIKPATDEPNQLNDGLRSLETDDDWKKKNMYD